MRLHQVENGVAWDRGNDCRHDEHAYITQITRHEADQNLPPSILQRLAMTGSAINQQVDPIWSATLLDEVFTRAHNLTGPVFSAPAGHYRSTWRSLHLADERV